MWECRPLVLRVSASDLVMSSPVYSVMRAPYFNALVVKSPMFVLSWLGKVVGRIMMPLPMVAGVAVIGLLGRLGCASVLSSFLFLVLLNSGLYCV